MDNNNALLQAHLMYFHDLFRNPRIAEPTQDQQDEFSQSCMDLICFLNHNPGVADGLYWNPAHYHHEWRDQIPVFNALLHFVLPVRTPGN